MLAESKRCSDRARYDGKKMCLRMRIMPCRAERNAAKVIIALCIQRSHQQLHLPIQAFTVKLVLSSPCY